MTVRQAFMADRGQQHGPARAPDIRLTPQGQAGIEELAERHGVGTDAVLTLLAAMHAGGGRQAQFNHPGLGGLGQWSRNGMLMIGDMFNHSLKAKVAALCDDVIALVDSGGIEHAVVSPSRWPSELGMPASTGSQNDMHYAVFPDSRRLAIEEAGKITLYDTGDHRISGFSQQQGATRSLRVRSQHGDIDLAELRLISDDQTVAAAQKNAPAAHPSQAAHDDIFAKIEGLHALHAKGVLSAAEYEAKKADLLARL